MKTTQATGRQISILLIALVVLLCATKVQSETFTATNTANWNVSTAWTNSVGVNGIPGTGDAVIIPSGKTVTVTVATTCNSLNIGGTLATAGQAFTVNTTTTVNSGGTLSVSG